MMLLACEVKATALLKRETAARSLFLTSSSIAKSLVACCQSAVKHEAL
jgi:hypothetical protein